MTKKNSSRFHKFTKKHIELRSYLDWQFDYAYFVYWSFEAHANCKQAPNKNHQKPTNFLQIYISGMFMLFIGLYIHKILFK